MSQVVGMTLVADVGAIRAGSEELRRLRDDAEQAARAAAGAGLRLAELAGAAEDATRDLLGLNRRTAEAARGAAELEQRFASAARAARSFQQQAEQLDRALRTGTIGQNHYYATLARARTAYEEAAAGARQFGAANENVVSSLSEGIKPFTDLLQQGTQIIETFGAVRNLVSRIPPAVLPLGMAVGTVATGVGVLVAANQSYRSSLQEVEMATRSFGGATGLSLSDLEAIAQRAAEAGGISVRTARQIQADTLRTGQIGGTVLEGLISLSKDYATVTGQNLDKSSVDLARIFADPSRGSLELQQSYAFLDTQSLQLIRTLTSQGNTTRAQEILLDRFGRHIRNLAKNDVPSLASALEYVRRASSNAFDALGQVTTLETTSQAIARLERERQQLLTGQELEKQRLAGETGGQPIPPEHVPIDARYASHASIDFQDKLQQNNAELQPLWRERAQAREQAALVGQNVRDRRADAAAIHLGQQAHPLQTPNTDASLALQLERVTNARTTLRTETEKAVKLAKEETAAATMLGLERDRYLARARTEIELSGQLLTNKERRERLDAAEALATAAHTQALTQLTHQLDLQATAQERLAEAAGQGEAAMRQAAI
ncbi:phage tail length tape measure family protein, partial [Arenibaculum sp.]|uniref:phage tail length tape measure family protein n=1 Tax=Arenibaculum sp. TaxID=2865862 RepID=UPI002E0FBF95|nr:phage tail length tape measure family protein [Arenibaculum sp.]